MLVDDNRLFHSEIISDTITNTDIYDFCDKEVYIPFGTRIIIKEEYRLGKPTEQFVYIEKHYDIDMDKINDFWIRIPATILDLDKIIDNIECE